jgi:hypothetical protein
MEKVLKAPRPELKIPEGKLEHPMIRGSRIHDAAELYMTQRLELIPELSQFHEQFEAMRTLQASNDIIFAIEENWAFDENWIPTGWSSTDAWLRMKVDMLMLKETEALLIDYKSGRRYGNEISHMTQAQLYQLGTFIRYPELEHIEVEFWYIDVGEITRARFTRNFGMQFLPLMSSKGKEVTNEIRFDAKPAAFNCKYCPYGNEEGNGSCKHAYSLLKK